MLLLLQRACKRIDNKWSVISCLFAAWLIIRSDVFSFDLLKCFFCFDALHQYILVSIAQSLLFLGLFLFLYQHFWWKVLLHLIHAEIPSVYLSASIYRMKPISRWTRVHSHVRGMRTMFYIICEPCLAVIKSVIKRTQEKLDRATRLNWFLLFSLAVACCARARALGEGQLGLCRERGWIERQSTRIPKTFYCCYSWV